MQKPLQQKEFFLHIFSYMHKSIVLVRCWKEFHLQNIQIPLNIQKMVFEIYM